MATMRTPERSAAQLAASRVMLEEIDRIVAGGESRFPNSSVFVAADLATDKVIGESHENGQTVVIVDEGENVRVLPAPVGSVVGGGRIGAALRQAGLASSS